KVAVAAEDAGGVADADAVLAAGLAFAGAGVDEGDEFPADGRGIDLAAGGGIEARIGAVASVDLVQLVGARVGVPRVAVDLGDGEGGAEVVAEAAAPGAGGEEEIGRRLVPIARHATVGDRREAGTGAIDAPR